jgi:hypothetical protein
METVVTIIFFTFWSSLIILALNPELFIHLRYRINIEDSSHYKKKPADLAPEEEKKKLDRYV